MVKIKAGTMYLVLVISLVIGIILSMVILLRYYYAIAASHDEVVVRLNQNISSGFAYARAIATDFHEEVRLETDLSSRGQDSVLILVKPWGLFRLAHVEASLGKRVMSRSALLGKASTQEQLTAINLVNNNRSALKLMGETNIIGNVLVPKGIVLTAWFNGKSYSNTELVQGEIAESKFVLPEVNASFREHLRSLLSQSIDSYRSSFSDTLTNRSFSDKPTSIYDDGDLIIQHALKNNIIVWADSKIFVSADSNLDNVLLVAPQIVVADSVTGRFQAIASESIKIGNGTQLRYPSALCLVSEVSGASIDVGSSLVEGTIVLLANTSLRGRVVLSQNSIFKGDVFAQGSIQLAGKVYGHVSCEKIEFNHGGEIRDNHLWNTTIDRTKLKQGFAFPFTLNQTTEVGIACWL